MLPSIPLPTNAKALIVPEAFRKLRRWGSCGGSPGSSSADMFNLLETAIPQMNSRMAGTIADGPERPPAACAVFAASDATRPTSWGGMSALGHLRRLNHD